MNWRGWLIGVAAACALSSASAQTSEESAREALNQLRALLPDRAAEAEAEARRILAEAPTSSIERSATHVIAIALAKQDRCDEQLPLAEQAVGAAEPSRFDWRFAFALNYECGRYDRATALLSEIHARYPDDLTRMPATMVGVVVPRSRDVALLSFFVNGGWITDEPADDFSFLRLTLMRAHLAAGNQDAARTVAHELVERGLSDFGVIVILLSDREFDRIVSAEPEVFNFERIADRFVANGFANYSTHPDRLSTVNALAGVLRTLDRQDEALALLDDALAREEDSAPFSDQTANLRWTYNLRAELRADLGLEEEALDDFRAGAGQAENGGVNVSQPLNRANYLLSLGRTEEALAQALAVRPIDLSPYGRTVRRHIIICANAELGYVDEMRAMLAEAEAHGSDSYQNLQVAAICADDYDLAARAFISRLESPRERGSAIIALQGFADEEDPQQRLSKHRIYARPDVSAAIQAAAHVNRFPIRRPY